MYDALQLICVVSRLKEVIPFRNNGALKTKGVVKDFNQLTSTMSFSLLR